jgi:hypothetical protein
MDAIRRTMHSGMLIDASKAKFRASGGEMIAMTLAASLLGLAIVVFARRLSGAFESSLGGTAFIASIAAAVVWAAASRLATSKAGYNIAPKWFRRFLEWAPTVALPLSGVALAVDGTPTSAILVAAALITGEEFWAARFVSGPAANSIPLSRAKIVVGRAAEARLSRRAPAAEIAPEAVEAVVAIDAEIHGDLWQEQRRLRNKYEEIICGVIRSRLGPRDRVTIEHLAFCPPMAAVPHLELEPVDGCDCSVRATHVYAYGARIEIKLDQGREEATECLVAFEARAALDVLRTGREVTSATEASHNGGIASAVERTID